MPQNLPQEILRAAVRLSNLEMLKRLLQERNLDFGCRPKPMQQPDGSFVIHVFAPQERLDQLRQSGYSFDVVANASAVGRERQAEVGAGDRFEGGGITPRGLGEKVRC